MDKGEKAGKLIFLEKETFKRAFEMEVGDSHVIRSAWHPKLNQILVGSGDGVVRYQICTVKSVFPDPQLFGLKAPDPSFFHTKLRNIFLKRS